MNSLSLASPWKRFGFGLALFVVVLLVRVALQPVLGSQFGFMFFTPAIGVAAWVSGRGTGFLVTFLATVAVWYLWLPHFGSFELQDPLTLLHLIMFAGIGLLASHFLARGREAILVVAEARAREAALREDYEVTLRSIGDAVIATDARGRITFMNATAESLAGVTFREANGQPVESVFRILDEETRHPRTSPVEEVLRERRVVELQNHTVLINRAGDAIPIADSAAPIFGSNGVLRGVVLVFHDIVEQAKTRRELRAANEALAQQLDDLRQLQELSWKVYRVATLQPMFGEVLRAALEVNRTEQGVLYLVSPERDGLVVAASRGFAPGMLDEKAVVEAKDGPCGTCSATRQRVVVEDVRTEPGYAAWRDLAERADFRAVHSTPLITRDGKLIGVLSVHFPDPHRPTEREMRLMDLYARNAADLIENAKLREQVQHELESRRAAEEELRVTTERFRLAAHGETLTLFEQDRDLRYRWLYPLHPEHARGIGRTDAELLPFEDADQLVALKRAVLSDGGVRRAEVRASLPDRVRYYDVTIVPKRSPTGEVDGVAGAAFDITERKEAAAALSRAKEDLLRVNRELEQRVAERTASLTDLLAEMEAFTYSVSHDLRSPLRAISGFAAVLREEYAKVLDPAGQELLDRIIRGGDRMNVLINDVLAYARVNRQELRLGPVSVTDSLRQVVQHAPELQPPHIELVTAPDFPLVFGTETFLTQVLANLLGNAVKFVPPGRQPRVEVTWELRGPFVRLWVSDNGIGIKAEHQARLFALFERLNAGRTYEGTGMGLAIVRRAVQRMGGSVGVESDGVNGSRFWIELRAAEPPIETKPSPSAGAAKSAKERSP